MRLEVFLLEDKQSYGLGPAYVLRFLAGIAVALLNVLPLLRVADANAKVVIAFQRKLHGSGDRVRRPWYLNRLVLPLLHYAGVLGGLAHLTRVLERDSSLKALGGLGAEILNRGGNRARCTRPLPAATEDGRPYPARVLQKIIVKRIFSSELSIDIPDEAARVLSAYPQCSELMLDLAQFSNARSQISAPQGVSIILEFAQLVGKAVAGGSIPPRGWVNDRSRKLALERKVASWHPLATLVSCYVKDATLFGSRTYRAAPHWMQLTLRQHAMRLETFSIDGASTLLKYETHLQACMLLMKLCCDCSHSSDLNWVRRVFRECLDSFSLGLET